MPGWLDGILQAIHGFAMGPEYPPNPNLTAAQTAVEVNRLVEMMRSRAVIADRIMGQISDEALRARFEPDVVVGVIEAAGREGPTSYMVYLERVVKEGAWGATGARVQAAAAAALPALEQRAAAEQKAAMLLRPAE